MTDVQQATELPPVADVAADVSVTDATSPGADLPPAATPDDAVAGEVAQPDAAPVDTAPVDTAPPAPDVAKDVAADPGDCLDASDCPQSSLPCMYPACQDGQCVLLSKPNDIACDDDNACTVQDACQQGICQGKGAVGLSTFPSACDSKALGVTQLAAGGYVLVGQACSGWVLGTDDSGKAKWSKNLAGHIAGVTVLPAAGGFVVAGSLVEGNQSQGWAAHIDLTGQVLWQAKPGKTWSSSLVAVGQGEPGQLAAVGTAKNQTGKAQAWAAGLTDKGEATWQYAWNDPQREAVAVTGVSGGWVIAGAAQLPGALKQDGWVSKLDGDGTLVWQKTFGGKDLDRFDAVLAMPDGGVLLAGQTASYSLVPGKLDVWLVRLDANGNQLWQRAYGGTETEKARHITGLSDGTILVTGTTATYGDGLWSPWMIRVDANGHLHWQRSPGTAAMDEGFFATETSTGLAIVGYTGSGPQSALLVRTSYWGWHWCKDLNQCEKLTLAECDDGLPCTTDDCNTDQGCAHAPLPNGLSCQTGLDQCVSGQCKTLLQ